MSLTFSALAAIFSILASIVYVHGILYRNKQPVKASSILGKLFTIATFIGMWQKDAVNGQILVSVLSIFVSTPLTLLYGRPGWAPIDIVCFTLGVCGLFVWTFIQTPEVAIFVGLFVLFIGSAPTWASAWEDPKRENKISVSLGIVASLCAFASATDMSFAHIAQPIAFLIMQCIMVYLLWVRPYYLAKGKTPH